jgi:hypothetical protein
MDDLFAKLKKLYVNDKSAVLVEHHPMSKRYRRAERRFLRIISEGKPIAKSARQNINEDMKIESLNLVVWVEPDLDLDEEFGHYVVFDLFFHKQNDSLFSATLFCYYDGQDNSSIKLKTKEDAIQFSKKLYPE